MNNEVVLINNIISQIGIHLSQATSDDIILRLLEDKVISEREAK